MKIKTKKWLTYSMIGLSLTAVGMVSMLTSCTKKAPKKPGKTTNKTGGFVEEKPNAKQAEDFAHGIIYDAKQPLPVPKEFANSNQTQKIVGNQQLNGKILKLDDDNELMFFGYYLAVGDANGNVHVHPHIIQPIELVLWENQWYDEDWDEKNPYIQVPNNPVVKISEGGILKGVRIYYANHNNLGNLIFDDFIVRVDGIGSSSAFIKKPTNFDDDWRYVQVDIPFDVDYLQSKLAEAKQNQLDSSAIRITGLSFVHTHGNNIIGAELTIQFRTPIYIKVVD
ncbi:hypothetical protein OF376_00360 [Ureaplasma miroungigenitalium]|uniref:Lipoprotein n=1 Tax=Ureaplasma miroungigenitalium TaxID=1042321 RepID=A0ABT3BM64_9BACT|nr:hypothetical protein [Ureaplasma miroungigenitalium]MCV3728242.1 hypothetical protein [Ureaplasma miroungigenitalium]MCV3734046.1 hypothetical protein [Ureaplasma miroungigenitalium]